MPHMKIKRIFVLPHFLGLGNNFEKDIILDFYLWFISTICSCNIYHHSVVRSRIALAICISSIKSLSLCNANCVLVVLKSVRVERGTMCSLLYVRLSCPLGTNSRFPYCVIATHPFLNYFYRNPKFETKQLSLSVVGCVIGDNGRWRWQFVPLCSSLGLKIEPKARKDCFLNLHLIPHFHLKSLTPIFGKLGEILQMFAFSKCF